MHTHFSRRTAFYLWHGLASSTRRSYGSGQRSFLNFVAVNPALQPAPGLSLPANTAAVAEWMTYLADRGLKHTTIKTYLSSVRYLHVNAGIPAAPCYSPILQQVYRGIKTNAIYQAPRAPKLPMGTLAVPQHLARGSAGFSLLRHSVFNSVIKLAWPGFKRRKEFTVLIRTAFNSIVHLSRHHESSPRFLPSCIQSPNRRASLLSAKINSFRRTGSTIVVACSPPHAASRASIDVFAMQRCLLQRSKIEAFEPPFRGTTRKALSRPHFKSLLKSQSSLALNNPTKSLYAGHGFRRGASTLTATARYKDSEILNQLLGLRHTNSYKLFIYTHPSPDRIPLQLSSRLHVARIVLF
jgi:hypothetical protein